MKLIAVIAIIFGVATSSFAADAAIVSGELKVDGIHFSGDNSTMTSANAVFQNLGAWSSLTLYSVGSVVQYQGMYYICTTVNTNTPPPNASFWSLLGGTASNLSGTWSGTQDVIVALGPTYNGTVTNVITQTGASFSGTNTTQSGFTGSMKGVISGNMFSFTSVGSIVNISTGCTSGAMFGTGTIQNNIYTFMGTGTIICGSTPFTIGYSGTMTKL